ncbi:hypothetical protein BUALT_Bualt17G0024200 [Buddleja alternifolia]|uniref:Acid phosphatase/vanadium-dependent haloperoxidase-related protein n=1 Tax=Buddleja alternifolia TaxID=168488 RepID=A0AAV6WG21_9LAMI|nr:hypothetical protein BUALT_Bualt17G0024200 [Buddleja alternifolia]
MVMQDSMPDAAATTTSSSSSLFTNYSLISALLAFAIAQSIKFFASWYIYLYIYTHTLHYSHSSILLCVLFIYNYNGYKENRIDLKILIGSGGMPSSHSATVTALTMAVGLHDGFGGSLFAATFILACVVMYDATGVRLHAGRQAEVLNQIVCELPSEHPLAESRPLRELLGHTPYQVIAGALLGVVTATIIHLIFGSGVRP